MSFKKFARVCSKRLMQAPLPTEGLPANAGTTIMLLHKGYPNNPAEALQHLASHFQESGVPQILTRLD
jgi:hypothetical protein